MEKDYNLLTKKLLAEGYTAENHPDYVYVGRSCQEKDNPLQNLDRGFRYYGWYVYGRTFRTPCGLQCKGTSCLSGMWRGNIKFCFEDDMATIKCPYHKKDCPEKNPWLRDAGYLGDRCNVHMVDEEYHYDGSVEGILKLEDEEIQRKAISFDLMHNGRTCRMHMRYDQEKGEWRMNYDPLECARLGCNGNFGGKIIDGKVICPIMGRPLDSMRGNVYYDIKTRFRRYDLDGTLFEGQVDTQIEKGVRYFEKPVNMDICRNIVTLCKDEISNYVKLNKFHDKIFFAEYYGREFSVEILNIRAEQRESRDLMQDLQDIRDGIKIFHASDLKKKTKEQKKQRREEAAKKKIEKLEKKILEVGYWNMEKYSLDRVHADKWLGMERINELEEIREQRIKEEQEKPVQISIFDMM